MNNGGVVLRWLRDELLASEVETAKRLGVDPYDVLTKIASRVKPGAEGLIFHPYLAVNVHHCGTPMLVVHSSVLHSRIKRTYDSSL